MRKLEVHEYLKQRDKQTVIMQRSPSEFPVQWLHVSCFYLVSGNLAQPLGGSSHLFLPQRPDLKDNDYIKTTEYSSRVATVQGEDSPFLEYSPRPYT